MHILTLILAAGLGHAGGVDPSARRDPATSFHGYLERTRELTRGTSRFGKLSRASSAADQATAYVGAGALRPAPEWENLEILQRRFEQMRDARVLRSDGATDFARRPTWLYPDDGCYTRAALGVQSLTELDPAAKTPAKIFVFGNLRVITPNSMIGSAYWWYHVAPVVRVGVTNYVLDPSIEPHRPLTVAEWIEAQSDVPASVQVAICGPGTYVPSDRCDLTTPPASAAPLVDGQKLLKLEFDRLFQLNRDPHRELGDRPPWL